MLVPKDLSDFVHRALAQGQSKDSIAAALAEAGWADTEIASALQAWHTGSDGTPVPKPVRSSAALDAFFYALLFVCFGMVVGNLLTLAFGQWNLWLPEPGEIYNRWSSSALRWSMAAVIVFLPTFLLLDHRDARRCQADPARLHGTIRRWLTALALFAAVTTLLGDALYLIYTWLDGQMTLRFAAKSATVAGVAGLTIAYFQSGKAPRPRLGLTPAAGALAGLTLVALGLTLWTLGGPAQGRAEQIDQWRISDMRTLVQDVQNCAQIDRDNLPDTLDPLICARNQAALTGFAADVTYRRVGAQAFELCTTLSAPTRIGRPYGMKIVGNQACLTGTTQ